MPHTPSRRKGPWTGYPIAVALLTVAGLVALRSMSQPERAEADAGPSRGSATPSPTEDPLARPLERTWIIGGVPEALPAAADLQACLAKGGYRRSKVMSATDARLVTYPELPDPVAIRPHPEGWQVATPVEKRRALALALHVLVTSCLEGPDRTVSDPLLGRRPDADGWPRLSPSGGVPVHLLVAMTPAHGGWLTEGLSALALPELALFRGAGRPPDPSDQALLEMVTGQLVASGRPQSNVLPLGDASVALAPWARIATAPWRPEGFSPEGAVMLLVEPETTPPTPLELTLAAPAPDPPSEPAPQAEPPPSASTDTARPRRRRRRRRRPEVPRAPTERPVFMPDYVD